VAFLSILSLIIFENWKKMPMHEKKAYNYTRFLFPSIFVILTGSALAYFHWGEGLSIPAGNTFYHALKNVGLITGWGMGCYYLFTGNHFLISRS
jgi:hypothetical protein